MAYLKNLNSCTACYSVNEFVPFEDVWFHYLLTSPLPWYYRIIPVKVEFSELYDISILMDRLAKDFSLVILDKYFDSHSAVIILVTNKSLLSIIDILKSYNDVKFVF